MRFHKELWYLVGSHELYFKLLLVYQARASVRKHIGVIFEAKKKGNVIKLYVYNKIILFCLVLQNNFGYRTVLMISNKGT